MGHQQGHRQDHWYLSVQPYPYMGNDVAAAGISDAAIVASPAWGSMSTGRDSMDQGGPQSPSCSFDQLS